MQRSIHQTVNMQDSNSPTAILSTLDLIDHMLCHHQEQALGLVELTLWHEQQAAALEAERRALAADVTAALATAHRWLR